MIRLAALLMIVLTSQLGAEELLVRHPAIGDPEGRNVYQVEILQAVLTRTIDSHGPFRLQPVADMPQAREIRSLVNNEWHDVLWTVTSADREAQMRAIQFPLLRGLLGHRLCLVRRSDPLFQSPQLPLKQQLIIGQGVTWPDTPIFAANQWVLEAGSDYQSTLRMLRAQRTNCFPRGLSEMDIELAAYASSDITVERRLSFLYFAPMYFFVAPNRPELAKRIEQGLLRIRESGEFFDIFTRNFQVDQLLQRYAMANRSAFCLDNPDLDRQTLADMQPFMISGPGTFADSCLSGL